MRITDGHLHVQPWSMLHPETLRVMRGTHTDAEVRAYREMQASPGKFLEFLDGEGVHRAVVINYVAPQVMGFTEKVNDFVTNYCARDPERLVAVGGLDLHKLRSAADGRKKVRALAKKGLRGLKLHPPHQWYYPDAYRTAREKRMDGLRGVYEAAQELGLPITIHTGTTIFPGARIKYGDPVFLDDVAVDFPDLKILMAHGGRPVWMRTAEFLARRHKNVFFELSGIPPKRLLEWWPRLEDLADKLVFGSDWPGPGVPGVGANVRSVMALPLQEQTKRKLFESNARRAWP